MEETVKILGLWSNIQILFSDLNYYRCLGSNSLQYYGHRRTSGDYSAP